jgi:hypothetical protein
MGLGRPSAVAHRATALGLMGTAVSPEGPLWGHNGSGPGFLTRCLPRPSMPR